VALTAVFAVPSAQAKVTCKGVHPPAEISLDGLPADPVADTAYRVGISVPGAAPANPSPILMLIRCVNAGEYPGKAIELPATGPVEIPLRFSEPGRWRAALMDRGGTFHSLGTIQVRSPAALSLWRFWWRWLDM
jgi:hypothetical protein